MKGGKMMRIANISIILILLAVTLGMASCNNSAIINHAPSSSAYVNQSTLESKPDPMTHMVIKADLIVLGTITEKRYDVVTVVSGKTTGKLAYTLFTLSVEKVIKGDPSIKEAIIQVPGGYIGEVYQVPILGYFQISDHVLLGLIKQKDDVYTLEFNTIEFTQCADSVFWIQGSAMSRDPLELIMGRICKILRINGIPNSLNEPCPEPAEPASPPKQ
jgi:hypothetical protein